MPGDNSEEKGRENPAPSVPEIPNQTSVPEAPGGEALLAEAHSGIGLQNEKAIKSAFPTALTSSNLQEASAAESVAFLSALGFEPRKLSEVLLEGLRAENALKEANAAYISACAEEKRRQAERLQIENRRLELLEALEHRRQGTYLLVSRVSLLSLPLVALAHLVGWVDFSSNSVVTYAVLAFLVIPEKSFHFLTQLLSLLGGLLSGRGR
jgi:hypothetical protein